MRLACDAVHILNRHQDDYITVFGESTNFLVALEHRLAATPYWEVHFREADELPDLPSWNDINHRPDVAIIEEATVRSISNFFLKGYVDEETISGKVPTRVYTNRYRFNRVKFRCLRRWRWRRKRVDTNVGPG